MGKGTSKKSKSFISKYMHKAGELFSDNVIARDMKSGGKHQYDKHGK